MVVHIAVGLRTLIGQNIRGKREGGSLPTAFFSE